MNITEIVRLSKKYSWIFILDLLSKCFGYVLLPWYLTYMTQQQFGVFTYLFYIITAVANVLNLGFTTSTGKLFNEYETQRGSYLFSLNAFLFSFIGVIFGLCLLTGLDKDIIGYLLKDAKFRYEDFRLGFLFYVAYLIVYGQISVFYQFSHKIKVFQLFNLIRIVLMNLAAVLFIKTVNESDTASSRLNIEVILSWIIFLPLCYKYIKEFKFEFAWGPVIRSLSIGLPVIAASSAALIYTVSDKYFLQRNESIEVLAIYNLALFLTTPLSFILTTFNLVWLPIFFKEKSIGQNFKRTKIVCLVLGGLFIIGGAIIMLAVSGLVHFKRIPLAYASSLKLFPFIIISIMIDGFSQLFNNFIIILEKTWFTLVITIFFGILMFILSRLLVPIYGIKGTVFILIVLSVGRLMALVLYIRKQLPNYIVTLENKF